MMPQVMQDIIYVFIVAIGFVIVFRMMSSFYTCREKRDVTHKIISIKNPSEH